MTFETKATIPSFGGKLLKLTHDADSVGCSMALNLYLPPQAFKEGAAKIPVLFYLSGLTCTGDNCAEKGFFQAAASEKGIAIVYPDTSPRSSPSPFPFPSSAPKPQGQKITRGQKLTSKQRRTQHPRRRRVLGFRNRRLLLPLLHSFPLQRQLPNVHLHNLHPPLDPLPRLPHPRFLPRLNNRPLNGRTRRPNPLPQKPRHVQKRLGIRTDLQSLKVSVGRESVQGVSGRGSGTVEGVGCYGTS